MLLSFFALFASQQELKTEFLTKVDGFNLTQCAVFSSADPSKKTSLYIPQFCWVQASATHSTRTTHKCSNHNSLLCLAITNGEEGKVEFFAALEKNDFSVWSFEKKQTDCLSEMIAQTGSTVASLICFQAHYPGLVLKSEHFSTCWSGLAYERTKERAEENRVARESYQTPTGMYTTTGEFISANAVTAYMSRMTKC